MGSLSSAIACLTAFPIQVAPGSRVKRQLRSDTDPLSVSTRVLFPDPSIPSIVISRIIPS